MAQTATLRVVIVGGGYAGLAALITLRQTLPEVELHLIDPRPHHLKLTHLHQTLQQPLDRYRVAFADLARRFHFTHHRAALDFTPPDLRRWQADRVVPLPGGALGFDELIIATGARSRVAVADERVVSLEDFCARAGSAILEEFLARTAGRARHIAVVGAGATGLQFLFELDHWMKSRGIAGHLRLISRHTRLLPSQPLAFHRYIESRLQRAGIDFLPGLQFEGRDGEAIVLREHATGHRQRLRSELTLVFPGVAPSPWRLEANRYGRVMLDDRPLPHVFAAGDCSHFAARGLNTLTAQAALRKGKQIATNIKRVHAGRLPYIYGYTDRGYFVSLGPLDGVGWLLSRYNVIVGLPAYLLKETIEAQYDLLLEGLDWYF